MLQFDDDYDLNKPYFQNHNYVEWLESFTIDETMDDSRRPTYKRLVRRLWDIPYILDDGGIGNDEDRGADGRELRMRYDIILHKKPGWSEIVTVERTELLRQLFGPCRMLEMLVALSMQMYDIMLDTGIYNSVSRWFWEIMNNLGLDALDDDCYDDMHGDIVVEDVIFEVLKRLGRQDEEGGLFHIFGWQDKEIWYQMHEYLGGYFA